MKNSFVALILLMTGCSPEIRVYSDYDPGYELYNYATFTWLKEKSIELGNNPLYYNELNDKRIKSAITEQLTKKGYRRSEKDPELVVHYHIIVDDQSIVTTDPHGYFYSPYWTHLRTNIQQYREGTLIIDFMDPKTNNLVWRGWAVSALEGRPLTPDKIDGLIRTAVGKIFRKFPNRKS